ncbi:MAG: DUF4912 domain-containing protein [Verrucomicrobiota bacterium]|nr:DUF4912 domain-containing protein [Verrucomicrobiota bacterium]
MDSNPTDPAASSAKNGGRAEAKKLRTFTLAPEPVTGDPADPGAHKYEVRSPGSPERFGSAPIFEDLGPLPSTYHEDTLFLVARDPRWLFCYWDFDWAKYRGETMPGGQARFFLKVLKADGTQETITEITPEARNWYVPVSSPDTLYTGEIGFFTAEGGWAPIVTSGAAQTPPDSLAEDARAEFATVPAHLSFERMLTLVKESMAEGESLLQAVARITGEGRNVAFHAGQAPTWTDQQKALLTALLGESLVERIGLGSEEIDQLLRKELQERLYSESASGFSQELLGLLAPGPSSLFSGITSWGASWSAQPFSVPRERGFFMHVNAEIIFYGGTDPDATVWVDGKQIKIGPDGTFRYHFTLPDGDFSIPIIAQSPDKVEIRSATLSFARETHRVGEVSNTGQPPNLAPLIGKK